MAGIRPFAAGDIEQVAALHRLVFSLPKNDPAERLESHRAYFRRVFLENPWTSTGLTSLVHEDASGKIGGFLGLVPRPLRAGEQSLMAAVSTQFVVHPEVRGKLVGVELMRAFLSGRQDVSIADEANQETRRLWERLGGTYVPLASLSWSLAVRPASRLVQRASRRRWVPGPVLRPLARALDHLTDARLRSHRTAQPQAGAVSSPVDSSQLHEWLVGPGGRRPLRGDYEPADLEWLLAADRFGSGSLERRWVKDPNGDPQGCYVYFLEPKGSAEVVLLQACEGMMATVFHVLVRDAYDAGATELWGRMDADLITPASLARCRLHPVGRWVLVAAKRPELQAMVQQAGHCLSKLEGEYPTRFR